MEQQQQTNRKFGTWQGTPISIKGEWGGHEFTADECSELFKGEIIEFEAISKDGKPYKVRGRLEKQEYNGAEFIGFKPIFDEKKNNEERFTGTWNGKEVNIKRIWNGHRFTDEEVRILLEGGIIEFDTVSKNTGNPYKAKGKLAEQTYEDNAYIGFKPIFN